jgi:gas vesicle protein
MLENKKLQTEPVYVHGHESHPGTFLAGLVFGGLAGAGAMLLLAPHSGRRTRADIRLRSVELRNQATEKVENATDQVRTTARHIQADVKKEARRLEHRGQEVLDEQAERVATAVADVKTAVQGS